jgi:hypothetical protein
LHDDFLPCLLTAAERLSDLSAAADLEWPA